MKARHKEERVFHAFKKHDRIRIWDQSAAGENEFWGGFGLNEKQIDALSKFKGAMLGCAAGDIFGSATRGGQTPDVGDNATADEEFLKSAASRGGMTHATQIMVVMAQSLIETGRFSLPHTAFKFGRYVEYSDAGKRIAVDIDSACLDSCRRIYRERLYTAEGVASDHICPAVRAIPIGLRYCTDADGAVEAAVKQTLITHASPKAAAAAVVVSLAVATCVTEKKAPDLRMMFATFADRAEAIDRTTARAVLGLSRAAHTRSVAETPHHAGAIPDLVTALAAFTDSGGDFLSSMSLVLRARPKTNDAFAIAGGLAGALSGAEAIPSSLLRVSPGVAYIELLAERIFTLTPASRLEPRSFL